MIVEETEEEKDSLAIFQKRSSTTKNTRACLYSSSENKLSAYNKDTHQKIFYFLPNYPIESNRINFEGYLPKDLRQGKYMVKATKDFNDWFRESRYTFECANKAVGQLFTIFVHKTNQLAHIKSGTFSLVDMDPRDCSQINQMIQRKQNLLIEPNSLIFGVSALHLISFENLANYNTYLLITFADNDLTYSLDDFIQRNSHQIHQKHCNFIESIINYFKKNQRISLYEATIDTDFLHHRKIYLLRNNCELTLLDPIFSLQPEPSIDIFLLKFNDKLLKFLMKTLKITPLKAYTEDDYSDEMDQAGVFIGYNHTNVQVVSKCNPDEEYSYMNLPDLNLGQILNSNKSIGITCVRVYTEFIIMHESTLSWGSSGSPLINESGVVIGVNFGNFYDKSSNTKVADCDKKKEEEVTLTNGDTPRRNNKILRKLSTDSKSIKNKKVSPVFEFVGLEDENVVNFDVKCQCEKIYNENRRKNYNLAINIRHPCLVTYILLKVRDKNYDFKLNSLKDTLERKEMIKHVPAETNKFVEMKAQPLPKESNNAVLTAEKEYNTRTRETSKALLKSGGRKTGK